VHSVYSKVFHVGTYLWLHHIFNMADNYFVFHETAMLTQLNGVFPFIWWHHIEVLERLALVTLGIISSLTGLAALMHQNCIVWSESVIFQTPRTKDVRVLAVHCSKSESRLEGGRTLATQLPFFKSLCNCTIIIC
jgi:hypothetical protein